MTITTTTFFSVDAEMQTIGAPDEDRSGGFARSSSSINTDTVGRRIRRARFHTSSSAPMPGRCGKLVTLSRHLPPGRLVPVGLTGARGSLWRPVALVIRRHATASSARSGFQPTRFA
jgi:hypothetical protein